MALHPKLAEFLEQIKNSSTKSFSQMSVAEMRQATKNFSSFQGEKEELFHVVNKYLQAKDHEYLIRLYIPSAEQKLPVVLFFHSGGFVKGDVDYADATCRRLANGSQAIVVAINYRLAPEHPFPAAIDDGFHRAWPSIRDGNFSTLITCFILYYFGTSSIRGFGLTLGIGILVSMFSAIAVTKTFLRLVSGKGKYLWWYGVREIETLD